MIVWKQPPKDHDQNPKSAQFVCAAAVDLIVPVRYLPKQERPAAAKDAHLVALAHNPGDGRILSTDDKARKEFFRVSD